MHPTGRITRGRRGNRRAAQKLRDVHTVVCPNCGASKLPHAACRNCGYVRPGLSLKRSEEQ